MKKPKYSPNFFRNLDPVATKKSIDKNIFILASENSKSARDNYSPVASGEIKNSFKLNKKGNSIILSSLNYKNTAGSGIDRYNYKKANKTYTINKNGKSFTVMAGKNAGKFLWFEKGHKDAKSRIDITKGVIL